MATAADIIRILEEIAPPDLAAAWDNSGLQLGSVRQEVKKVMVALDPTPQVIAHAAVESVDLLITHHPLFFDPIRSICLDTPLGASVGMAIAHAIVIYSAHTSLDAAPMGLNHMLAAKIGLMDQEPLERTSAGDGGLPLAGLGRVGRLHPSLTLGALCGRLKESLGLESLRVIGDPGTVISRAALCAGSGSSLLGLFFSSGAEVYITGDVRYHDALKVKERALALIDIGHFGSEHIVVKGLTAHLSDLLKSVFPEIAIVSCELEKDPFTPW